MQKAAVSKHMKNIFASGELLREQVVSKMETTAADGKRYFVDYYNLDMILSVGYRVNSVNATHFRQWATQVLRKYIMHGYVFNRRFERIEHRLAQVEEKQTAFDLELHTSLPPAQGVFFEGQVFDARLFVENLIRNAKKEIILVDTYVNSDVIDMLNERAQGVTATIYTDTVSKALMEAERLSEQQFGREIVLQQYRSHFHDRFLLIDDDLYHFGASFKDLGKRLFAFEKMGIDKSLIISQL